MQIAITELEESRKKEQEKHGEMVSGLQQQIQLMEKELQAAKQVLHFTPTGKGGGGGILLYGCWSVYRSGGLN